MDYETSNNVHQIAVPGKDIEDVAISPDGHIVGYYCDDDLVSCLKYCLSPQETFICAYF